MPVGQKKEKYQTDWMSVFRTKGVCFSTSSRAIVLPEEDMHPNRSKQNKRTPDMNMHVPDPPEVVKSDSPNPAKRACEEIKKYAGVLEHYLVQVELQEADQERFDKLNEQNAVLVQQIEEMKIWMDMVKQALQHHDDGELSSRQFANEIDAAIKGWEAI